MTFYINIDTRDGVITLQADAIDNKTAEKIKESLPVTSQLRKWGEEIYFDTEIEAPSQNATMDVDVGDLAYWPQGRGLCIFYGPTPISAREKPVPASEVVIVGKLKADAGQLKNIPEGSRITVN